MAIYPETRSDVGRIFPDVSWLVSDTPTHMRILDDNGLETSIRFCAPLSDGTELTSSVNEKLHTVIREVVFYCRYGSVSAVSTGKAQRQIAQKLVSLADWMVRNGIYSFSHLGMAHITKYCDAAANGYEALLDAPHRVFEFMKAKIENGEAMEGLTFSEIRKTVFRTNLAFPRAESVFNDIKLHCDSHDVSTFVYTQPALRPPSGDGLYAGAHAIHLLFSLREYLTHSLAFDPFPDGLPGNVTTNTKRGLTPTIPECAALHMMQEAVRWVVDVGPKLMDLNLKIRKIKNACAGVQNKHIRKLIDRFNETYESDFGFRLAVGTKTEFGEIRYSTAIRTLLPVACYITVGMLSARRMVELKTLKVDAIKGSRAQGYWLKTYIAKTMRESDLVPVPEVITLAVRLMKRFGNEVRGTVGTNLFVRKRARKSDKRNGGSDVGKIETSLDEFANAIGCPYVKVKGKWSPWHFSSHQFRKMFAILYVWRYDAGDLSSLSYHLRHFTIEMTLAYVRDKEMVRLIGGEMFRLAASKTQAMLSGAIHPAGTFAKKLLRLVEQLRPLVRLASDADVERQLEKLVKDKNISFKANPWGFCACKAVPSNIRRAACQQKDCHTGKLGVDGRPDHSGSDEARCSGCFFFFTDETRKPHWERVEGELGSKLESAVHLAPLMRARFEKHLAKMKGFSTNAFRGA